MPYTPLPPVPVLITVADMDDTSFARLVKALTFAGLEVGVALSSMGMITGGCCPDRVEGLGILPGVISVETDRPHISFEGVSPPG